MLYSQPKAGAAVATINICLYRFLSLVCSKIMFVLQIGSVAQTDSCNIALDQADTVDRAVLLQYSVNHGISWHVIAQHQPKDFIKAQRVSYNIPL